MTLLVCVTARISQKANSGEPERGRRTVSSIRNTDTEIKFYGYSIQTDDVVIRCRAPAFNCPRIQAPSISRLVSRRSNQISEFHRRYVSSIYYGKGKSTWLYIPRDLQVNQSHCQPSSANVPETVAFLACRNRNVRSE